MSSSSVPAARTRRSADERRAQIAGAARAIALERGLSAITLRSVAAEVGVAPALVAHHASGMDDLVARTFSAIVGEELGEVRALAAAEPDPRAALRGVLHTLMDHARAEVTLVWVQAWALGGRSEPLAAAVRTQMDDWELFLAELLAALDDPGREGAAASAPRSLARQILGMIDGVNAHALVRWHEGDDPAALLVRSVEALLRLPEGALAAP